MIFGMTRSRMSLLRFSPSTQLARPFGMSEAPCGGKWRRPSPPVNVLYRILRKFSRDSCPSRERISQVGIVTPDEVIVHLGPIQVAHHVPAHLPLDLVGGPGRPWSPKRCGYTT